MASAAKEKAEGPVVTPAGSASNPAPLLSVQGLAKAYSGRRVVDGVSIHVGAGEIVGLLGPNGAGKTTSFNMTVGLVRPDAGSVRFLGTDITRMPMHRRARLGIGYLTQEPSVFRKLTVEQNILAILETCEGSSADRRSRLAHLLDELDLTRLAKSHAYQLSGGEKRRLEITRALVTSPRLLLLDEPFSNLDVELRERLAHEVRNILKQAGATALLVTHDQLEAFAIGDQIGVMHEGRLHQWDDAYTLYHRPATRFVADFIGHGVFAPATLREVNQQIVVQTPLGELTDVAECPLPCAFSGGECDVLLRADDIVHDDDAPVKAQILRKAFRGSEFLYTLQLKTGETVLAHVPSHHDHKVGEWIGIRPEVDHVVTFNRACPVQHTELCQLPCAAPQIRQAHG